MNTDNDPADVRNAPKTQDPMNPRAIEITVFKKSAGILSKTITAAVDGSPVSDGSACRMSSGEAKRMPLPGRAEALVEVIDNMASDPHRTQASALGPHSFIKKGNLPLYWTKNEDGLSTDWRGKRIWMNPPYGSVIGHWVKKAATGRAEVVVCLLPARTDTRWFHDHIYQNPHAEIRFIKGRIRFAGAAHSAPFPSMLVIFRNPSS